LTSAFFKGGLELRADVAGVVGSGEGDGEEEVQECKLHGWSIRRQEVIIDCW
jgi:hypothetical protein